MERNSDAEIPVTWPPEYPRHRAVDAATARAMDRAASAEFGIPSVVLMEHASRGIAEIAAALTPDEAPVLVCAGPGNNGGDGYGAARFLAAWGRDVQVLQMSPIPPRSDDAQMEVRLATALGMVEAIYDAPERLQELLEQGPGLVVDALFGVGLERPLEGPYDAWIAAINAADIAVLAVDVPSGMHTDTGEALPVAVQADVTATMAAPKAGFAPGAPGEALAGHVIELEIGLPRALLAAYEV